MMEPEWIIDSHVHLDRVLEGAPSRIPWMMERRVIPVSWAFCEGAKSLPGVLGYLEAHARLIHGLRSRGLAAYYVIGIHPRCIPPDTLPNEATDRFLWKTFKDFFRDPYCLGVGEIGLETLSDREEDMFRRQLSAVRSFPHKTVCVHTPRNNKAKVTRRITEILDETSLDPSRIVVDHVTPETLSLVISTDFRIGVTLSPVKCSGQDVSDMLGQYPEVISRLMANTDSNREFYEDEVRLFRHSDLLSDTEKRRVGFENASRFFGIWADAS